jgi:ABC-type transport system involved in multi-copper enzyme maturation permease subunit
VSAAESAHDARGHARYGSSPMSPVAEINLVASRELRKNVRSVKGIILGVLTLLGGTLAAVLIALVDEMQNSRIAQKVSPEELHDIKVEALSKMFRDNDMGRALADAPGVLLPILGQTVWLTPLLVALMGFDTIAGDLQHKTVRYWTVRSRRWSYYLGKWFGLWATVSIVTLSMDALVWIVCIARGQATFAATLGWGMRFWLTSLPMSAVWCGIAVLVSSLVRTPILALLSTCGAFVLLWAMYGLGIAGIVWDVAWLRPLMYVYPNHYEDLILHPFVHKMAIGLGACAGMAALYIGIGTFLFNRRDV